MIREQLERFRHLADPGPFDYPWTYHHPGHGKRQQHMVVGCLIHGNEHGTLPAACEFVEALRQGAVQSEGPVTVMLGNVEAALADRRFLEEDFNRVFTFDRPATTLERRLAERVRPILNAADVFFDFHQTQTPTEQPFWTFPWSPELGLWARVLQTAPVALTRRAGQAFSQGTCCLDEYVRNRGRVGITVELGYRGDDPAQATNALESMKRMVSTVNLIQSGRRLEDLAAEAAPIKCFTTTYVETSHTKEHALRPGLRNWSKVEAGERLTAPASPELVAPRAGYVLFPKYPSGQDPVPPELFRLASEVKDLAELDG